MVNAPSLSEGHPIRENNSLSSINQKSLWTLSASPTQKARD
ncbi:hypothetical protein HMPREF1872_01118 [Amygdalobacter nucleatus]|uniref:Uncharacterized protein n=1 Tax=Amygdalobacter nucleatus TaxID=3029274 RepID=A0A133Y8P9_9FIRM|nr:hypothetical protein HMPREF1872_01118 [Amygdalobacter nucleatus]